MENLSFEPFAIVLSVCSSFFLGFLWYGPFFGRTWVKLVKMDTSQNVTSEEMGRGMLLSLLNATLTSFVLAALVQIWRPSTWIKDAVDYDSKVYYGTVTAFACWLGFYLPVGLNTLAWERKPFNLFILNTGYHLTNLVLIAVIVSVNH